MPTYPKVGKRIRTKRDADRAKDLAESAKVRVRSEGRCEVVERREELQRLLPGDYEIEIIEERCPLRAAHVMHLIGGNGKRGVGISALAQHKLHGCAGHHREIDGGIGGKKLRRLGGPIPFWTDCYERVR